MKLVMTKEEYISLYEKCLSGRCTTEEKKLLENYHDEFSLDNFNYDNSLDKEEYILMQRMYRKLQRKTQPTPTFNILYLKKPAIAAAIGLVLLSSVFYLLHQNNIDPQQQHSFKDIIKPGGDAAPVLTLADGSEIVLDTLGKGVVAQQGTTRIRKGTNQLIFDFTKTQNKENTKFAGLNTISVPRGGQYSVILSDGTKVWLNAESSLKFPVAFSQHHRKVELTGEAYFEVAENKNIPFKVMAGDTEVKVLGTHFNVSAYPEDKRVNTTLLEGSVKVTSGGYKALLKPGQLAVSANNQSIKISNIQSEDAIGWKNGYFIFHDENIKSIMAKVARWYDVEIEYKGNMEGKDFWGKVSRQENISDLLKSLELSGTVRFKIEGRRIIVMP